MANDFLKIYPDDITKADEQYVPIEEEEEEEEEELRPAA